MIDPRAAVAAEMRIPRRNPDVTFQELDEGRGVLLHLETGAYYSLNWVGCYVWEHVDGVRTQSDLVAALCAEAPDAPAHVGRDVEKFIASLVDRDLLRW